MARGDKLRRVLLALAAQRVTQAIEPMNSRLFFLHIPKCGGASMLMDLSRVAANSTNLAAAGQMKSAEACFGCVANLSSAALVPPPIARTTDGNRLLITSMRSPVAHIESQFMFLKYSGGWCKGRNGLTPKNNFPHFPNDTAAFADFLKHYMAPSWEPDGSGSAQYHGELHE